MESIRAHFPQPTQFDATFMVFTFTPSDEAIELPLSLYEALEVEVDTVELELGVVVFSDVCSLQETSRKLAIRNTNRALFALFLGFKRNAFIKYV